MRPASVCCHANQLRQLLRYLSMRGLAARGLAEAVPSVGCWREVGVPQSPVRPAIERILESCDRSRRVGVRDFAILMLQARLGLRAVEVSRLGLDDLDWRSGEIEIDGKGHQRARLPLSGDVGDALVAYLRLRRRHESRRVFLSEHAPTRPIEPPGVRSVVRDACRRAGIEHVAAHRLRHAVAGELLRAGATLAHLTRIYPYRPDEPLVAVSGSPTRRARTPPGGAAAAAAATTTTTTTSP